MFLIPIGHEETSVRRLPWITLGVMILCFLGLILSGGASMSSAHDEEVRQRIEEALEYYLAHPYLELDADVRELAEMHSGEKLDRLVEMYGGVFEPPAEAQRREAQAELDALVARVQESLDSHPYVRFGLVPGDFSVLGLLTHMFMHAGWLHLLGNLLMLYLAGPYIEDAWGRPLYAGFYLASGIVAALGFVALHPDIQVPLVGASGAIAGLMGAFLVRFWSTKIRFFYMVGVFVRGTFWAPAWLMLPLWLVEQLFMAALTSDSEGQGGVAYWAHVGGFAFGAGVAWLIRAKRVEERYLRPAIEARINATVIDNAAVERALELHANGRGEVALRMLSDEFRSRPTNRDAALALWSVALDLERPEEGADAMLRLIQEEIVGGDRPAALQHWEELEARVPNAKIPPILCARIAQALAAAGDRDRSAMMLRRALLEAGRALSPAAALQIARVARLVDPPTATAALRLALASPGLDPESRAEIERTLAALEPAPLSPA